MQRERVPPDRRKKEKLFDNNFGKCGSVFKILSAIDLQENYLCIHDKDFHLTCSMLPQYLVKFENPKMPVIF